MVGPVDLGVTVLALAIHHEEAVRLSGKRLVPARLVTALTQPGALQGQEARVVRPVRIVAVEAVFLDR